MGILSAIKSTFNIGGCHIDIHLAEGGLVQGGMVAGEVRLRGGGYRQEARSLRLALVEFWTESRGSGKHRRTVTVTREHSGIQLASPCAIDPGEEQSYRFDLELPLDARLSTAGQAQGWRLQVEMDISGAVDPATSLGLDVGPASQLQALVRLWGEVLQWTEQPEKRSWSRYRCSTNFRLLPPAELQADFDFLDLECRPIAGGAAWQVALVFDVQEQRFLDYLKALINIDKSRHVQRIESAALEGEPEARRTLAEGMVKLMQSIIEARRR